VVIQPMLGDVLALADGYEDRRHRLAAFDGLNENRAAETRPSV
jgi:hypothetical protein